ncbi:hypothetical protein COV15_00050 [Candidatus Woesearchaeota archaeon CG10_big_fil_rev_8_21_14_0_10_34_12]|nr:MAG: hypothetical protein COV15_00050 [Candidatus Woesearchaeota archaeon CG10_big_fil_rev_8_21_14_0_10_34_12]
MNWLIIGILIVMVLVVIKIRYISHKTAIVALLILSLLFYVSFSKVISDEGINLKSLSGLDQAGKIYAGWVVKSFDNLKTVTGEATRLDWGIAKDNPPD